MQNSKSDNKCCGNCYFFHTGRCRRPPLFIKLTCSYFLNIPSPPFPDVRETMWCGEYKGKTHSKELQDFIQKIIDGANNDVVTWPIEQPKWP